ncbi:MAG: carbohydrate kinase [Pyrinomonadaceae bacterium]
MEEAFKMVGVGEILWDIMPDGKKLGGAPANFAYVAGQLGNRGLVLSRVGNDPEGAEIIGQLNDKGVVSDLIQIDPEHPTGRVRVEFVEGQPHYEIVEDVAWDHLDFSEPWKMVARSADAICFGTLAQRSGKSRETVGKLIGSAGEKTRVIFDVNLRRDFFSPEILDRSMRAADVLKVNHEEFPKIGLMFGFDPEDRVGCARNLMEKFKLRLVCITCGNEGGLLISGRRISRSAGRPIRVGDPVGAGDAFTAGLVHGILRGWDLQKTNDFANRTGAFLASKKGAMPDFSDFGEIPG